MALNLLKSSKKAPPLVAVDLTGNTVRIALARQYGEQIVFEDVRRQKFGDNSDTEISQFLIACCNEWGIKQRQAICLIPSKLFISKNVDMPSNDPEEISKIIDLQAGRYTPYSRDEIVIDYLCMVTEGQHYTNVILVIVNRKLIDRYVQIFERAGVYLSRIAVSSEGMARIYNQVMPSDQLNGAFAGIHMDEDSTDLTIIDKGQMAFVRSLPVGASHFKSDAAGAQKTFVNELNKSITSYQDHGVGQPVKGLLITGMISGLESLETQVRTSLPGFEDPGVPVKMEPYARMFQTHESLMEKAGKDTYFDLMACLKSKEDLKIDLVPKEIKLKRKFREGGKEIVTMGILIMTCLVMICVFLASKIYLKRNLIQKLEVTAEDMASQARLLEQASTKTRVLRNLILYRGKGLYVFDKVTSLIGEDIYLSNFSYDQDGNLQLVGTAETMSGVFAFVTKLEESGYFSSVITNETKTRKEGSREVADFDIECILLEEI